MPPEIKAERKAMLDAALHIIEECGADAVSARSVAKRIGISTQPIYREFGGMGGFREAVFLRALEELTGAIGGDALDQAVKYVKFASEHRNLFNFLFRSRKCVYDGLDGMAHGIVSDTGIIDKLTEITGLPKESVYRVHLYIWMALHGLAAMAADNDVKLTDGEIEEFTRDITVALTKYTGSKAE